MTVSAVCWLLFVMTVIAASVIHCAGTVMIQWKFLPVQPLPYGLRQQLCSLVLSPAAVHTAALPYIPVILCLCPLCYLP